MFFIDFSTVIGDFICKAFTQDQYFNLFSQIAHDIMGRTSTILDQPKLLHCWQTLLKIQ